MLGLGNIGGLASIPVMDGKSLLFKEFAGIDAFPICLETQDVDEIVNIVKNIAPTLGGINLEDISAPRCFEIEEKLQAQVDIPVFHDDQHGTAVVVSAAVINSAKFTGRSLESIKAVINGAGAAGTAIAKMLMNLGIKDIVACDSKGILTNDRDDLNEEKTRGSYEHVSDKGISCRCSKGQRLVYRCVCCKSAHTGHGENDER